MKNISTALAAHLAGEVTNLATCWLVTRRDGTTLGFTDHDRDLVFGGVTYMAETGFTPSAVAADSTLAVDNLEAEGMLSSGSITEADIMAGLYDYAEIHIFMVNYTDLTQGALKLKRGWIGEVAMQRGRFAAELRGMAQAFSQNIGELFSPSCRATLGDSRCKVDLSAFTASGSVTAPGLPANQNFTDAARGEASGAFAGGTIRFSSGANSGLSMEVKDYVLLASGGGAITLSLPMPYAPAAGDAYVLTQGCDKTFSTCNAKFNNLVNFRGEPHVPGLDAMLTTSGTMGG